MKRNGIIIAVVTVLAILLWIRHCRTNAKNTSAGKVSSVDATVAAHGNQVRSGLLATKDSLPAGASLPAGSKRGCGQLCRHSGAGSGQGLVERDEFDFSRRRQRF